MLTRYFIGIDVAKATLDWAVCGPEGICLQTQSANTPVGIRATLKTLRTLPQFEPGACVCCLEHTGVYNAHVLDELDRQGFRLWLEASLQIKQAGGLQRGKSDRIDAVRIATYAFRFRDRPRLWQPPRPVLAQLTHLSALRQRLLSVNQQLRLPLTEQKRFTPPALQRQLEAACRASVGALKKDLRAVEAQIDGLIQADDTLRELFGLMTSVPGIGAVTATEVLVATNEMKAFNDPRKLACHAGVAPFEHRSGTSIRGRTRVNHQARKRLKTLFHLAAMAAVRSKGELRTYYERKVAEGKNKMLILNAGRNKLVHRVCAVVRRKQNYDFSFSPSLV
jgi:transposase